MGISELGRLEGDPDQGESSLAAQAGRLLALARQSRDS